jgi:transposase-like protein
MTMTPKPGYRRVKKYDPDIAEKIIEAIEDGSSMVEICRELDFRVSTFHGWVVDNVDGLAAKYARAKKISAEKDFELAREIALGKHRTTDGKIEVMRDRLSVDYLKWSNARKNPKLYGEASLLHVVSDAVDEKIVPRTQEEKDAARAAFLERHSKGRG